MRVERVRVCHPSGGPQLTKLAEQDSTDINLIMDSWIGSGGALPGRLNPAVGRYGDFSSGMDYWSALTAVKQAESDFAALPPKIRNHVENDPGNFLDMFDDPARRDELVELGLVPKPAEEPAEEKAPKEVVESPKVAVKDSPGEPSSPVESERKVQDALFD